MTYSGISNVKPEHPDWTFVAGIDESEPYEVDMTEVWRKADGTFVLVTASGCSCWDGDYETQDLASIEDIAAIALSAERDAYRYNPSVAGARDLYAATVAAVGL